MVSSEYNVLLKMKQTVMLSYIHLIILLKFNTGSCEECKTYECQYCMPFVCLKSATKDETLRLNCRTSSLDTLVEFLDPNGKLYRYCPAYLYGDGKNCSKHVTQDTISNITTLTLYETLDTSNFGEWKCIFGTNHTYDTFTVKPVDFPPSVSPSSSADTPITNYFYGKVSFIGKRMLFKFTCALLHLPEDNSLTFLVNGKTVDILRFENLSCYNTKGKCTESNCSCSMLTNTFKWIYSSSTLVQKWKFEVQARYFDTSTGKIDKVSLSRTFNGEDFGTLKVLTETIRVGRKETEWKGYKRSQTVSGMTKHPLSNKAVILVVITALFFIILIIVMCKHRIAKLSHENQQVVIEEISPGEKLKAQYHDVGNYDMEMTPDREDIIYLDDDICKLCKRNPIFMYCCDCALFQCQICCQGHIKNNKNHSYVKILGRKEIPEVCNGCRSKGTHFVCTLCKKLFCNSCCINHNMHKKFIQELK